VNGNVLKQERKGGERRKDASKSTLGCSFLLSERMGREKERETNLHLRITQHLLLVLLHHLQQRLGELEMRSYQFPRRPGGFPSFVETVGVEVVELSDGTEKGNLSAL